MRLTQKQETFCLKYFELGNASEAARIARYSVKTAAVMGAENLSKPKIIERIDELRQKAEDASIANVRERQQILTEVARADLLDYQEVGADGGYLSIGKESPNTRAIREITSRTEYDKDGTGAALVTTVKLHDSTKAIDLLNKMDKVYTEGATVNIDNRTLNIKVEDDPKRALVSLLDSIASRAREGEVDKQPDPGTDEKTAL